MRVESLFILIGLAYFLEIPAASVVRAIDPPPGSYLQTCKNPGVFKDYLLRVSCKNSRGEFKTSSLRFFFLCKGDISNGGGFLSCDKTTDSPKFKTALEAFSAASVIVLGRDIKGTDIPQDSANVRPGGDGQGELMTWIEKLFLSDKGQQYHDGVTLTQALEVVKEYVSKNPGPLKETVDNAFRKVYGRDATVAEYNKWGVPVAEKKLWYATLVSKLKQENGSK